MRRLILLGVIGLVAGAAAPAGAAERVVKLRHGPIEVSGYAVKYRTDKVPAPKVDGYITRMYARVVDKKGRPLPVEQVMLHHVAFLDMGSPARPKRDDSYCPNRPGRRFYGTGEEDQPMELPPGYGYKVRAGDRWEATWMLMNHRPQVDEAYIEYEMTISDGPLAPVKPYWIGVVPCEGDPIFDVPGGGRPGAVQREAKSWIVPTDGRIVASGGHLHGGSLGLSLRQPECADRLLVGSRPLYGRPDHPYYNVLPVLHEPGPIGTSWTTTPTGIDIRKGERMRITAFYDASAMHVRAMGILHVYVASPRAGLPPADEQPCLPLPDDRIEAQQKPDGLLTPPVVTVPLTGIGPDGRARTIQRPPGRTVRYTTKRVELRVDQTRLTPANLSVPRGTTVRWRFDATNSHDITVADGPFGFSSQPLRFGRAYERRLDRPGTYKLFCSLHPVQMTQTITVRR